MVLSAGGSPHLRSVLDAVTGSEPAPEHVVLIWSGAVPAPSGLSPSVTVRHLAFGTFDHGHTRQLALESCTTDLLAFVSDDAVPAAREWLKLLTAPFPREIVGAVFGRQQARPEAPLAEKVYRSVRYPERGVRIGPESFSAVERVMLPISDANAAYRVTALRAVGGFPHPCSYGEDQVCAANLVRGGWEVVYAPDAVVWHSHDLGWSDVLLRARQAGALSRQAHVESASPSFSDAAPVRTLLRLLREGWAQGGASGVVSIIMYAGLRAAGYAIGRVLG